MLVLNKFFINFLVFVLEFHLQVNKQNRVGDILWQNYISVDFTTVSIQEPVLFSSRQFSYKLQVTGLRNELGVGLNGNIVWVNSPFRPGDFNIAQIFREDLRNELLHNPKVL